MDLEIEMSCLSVSRSQNLIKNIWIIKLKPVSILTSDGVFLWAEKAVDTLSLFYTGPPLATVM